MLALVFLWQGVAQVAGQQATTPANKFFPFEGINDPAKQCLDILCYDPVTWVGGKEEVCRHRKRKTCEEKTQEVCTEVPVAECEVTGVTDCKNSLTEKPLNDDKVDGEMFMEHNCTTIPINITEIKMAPSCVNMTKNVCEKMWVPDPPYWKDVNCKEMVWENCTLQPRPTLVTIDICKCNKTEIWYNVYKKNETSVCLEHVNTCVPRAVTKCTNKLVKKCTNVTWNECKEECYNECEMMHFREPIQPPDHRRWCSHVEIELPPGVPRSPKKDAADLFDLRDSSDSDRNPKSLEASRSSGSSLTPPTRNPRSTTAKPRREKKASIEKPKAAEDKPDVAALSNQVETSSEWSISRVVSNTVSEDGTGQGKDEENGGEVRGGKK